MKQEDLAAAMMLEGIEMSSKILSRIETGVRYITDLELIAFAEVLNVSTAWLLHETEDSSRR
jgi:transcriptional regulator with XRE-family HTH domain